MYRDDPVHKVQRILIKLNCEAIGKRAAWDYQAVIQGNIVNIVSCLNDPLKECLETSLGLSGIDLVARKRLIGLELINSARNQHGLIDKEGMANLPQLGAVRAQRREILNGNAHRRGGLAALGKDHRNGARPGGAVPGVGIAEDGLGEAETVEIDRKS